MSKEPFPRIEDLERAAALAGATVVMAMAAPAAAQASNGGGLNRTVQHELAQDVHGIRNTGGFSASIHGGTETFRDITAIKYGYIDISFQTPANRHMIDTKDVKSLTVDEYLTPSAGHRVLVNALSARKNRNGSWALSVKDHNPRTGERAARTDSTSPHRRRHVGRLGLEGARNFNKEVRTLITAAAVRDDTPVDMGIPKGF